MNTLRKKTILNESGHKMNNQNLAILINKLQAPVIVSEILTGKDKAEETRYALTELISDMQPDAAILAIALSMRKIVQPFLKASPSLQMTEIECTRLTEDYAQIWMDSPLSASTDPTDALDTLEQACEDLEYLEELLELNINYLSAKDAGGAELCALLKHQASSQRMTAEAICQAIDYKEAQIVQETLSIDPTAIDNIVTFPSGE